MTYASGSRVDSQPFVSPHSLATTNLTMECSIALTGADYVLIASDMSVARSIVRMKSNEDKTKILGPNLVMAYSGEPGKHSLAFTSCESCW